MRPYQAEVLLSVIPGIYLTRLKIGTHAYIKHNMKYHAPFYGWIRFNDGSGSLVPFRSFDWFYKRLSTMRYESFQVITMSALVMEQFQVRD